MKLLVARQCRNVGYNSGITVYVECDPCPLYSSATHEVSIQNQRKREIEGDVTSMIEHKFAMFLDNGQPVDRVTKHVVTRTIESMTRKLIQGPRGNGQETVKTDFSYVDETEKLRSLASRHLIYVSYWVEVK